MTPSTRRSRGKSSSSKNKSRFTNLQMVQSSDSSMNVFTFNVAPNNDVMESIFDIAHRDHVSITVISASGTINKVTLQSSSHSTSSLILHGPFTLVSLTGSYLYNNQYTLHPGASPPFPLSFGINLSTSQGEVFCGIVGGRVIAGENVRVTISMYNNPDILKYTIECSERDDNHNDNNNNLNYNNNPNNFNGGDDLLEFNPVTLGVRGW
ncbi:unnamed protein product [Sphenostylis stenocarpa]|uniref:PPC domain-containing protein n=1 Tax=Sphenostylis stenocarpa TaxID=92480 RepID=A0AA86SLW6_9FABA|nr:unnamed protein product [Sphenostylis stenocarpa]